MAGGPLMLRECDDELLEELVHGHLSPWQRSQVEAHVAQCLRCLGELEWLRREAELFTARRSVETEVPELVRARLFAAVAQRVWRPGRRAWLGAAATVSALAAAAVLAISLQGGSLRSALMSHVHLEIHTDDHADDSGRVLDEAEEQYRDAIGTLESEHQAQRVRDPVEVARRLEATLASTREGLVAARDGAGTDAESRLRVLDGYAEYLHTLQEIVQTETAAGAGQEEHR